MRLTVIDGVHRVSAAKAPEEKPWDVTATVMDTPTTGFRLQLSRREARRLGFALVEASS